MFLGEKGVPWKGLKVIKPATSYGSLYNYYNKLSTESPRAEITATLTWIQRSSLRCCCWPWWQRTGSLDTGSWWILPRDQAPGDMDLEPRRTTMTWDWTVAELGYVCLFLCLLVRSFVRSFVCLFEHACGFRKVIQRIKWFYRTKTKGKSICLKISVPVLLGLSFNNTGYMYLHSQEPSTQHPPVFSTF